MHWHPWKSWIVAAMAASPCLAGCGRPQAAPTPAAPEVAVVTIQPQKLLLTTKLPGRTSACRTAEIRPQVNGLLQKRSFTEGAYVKADDLLYKIDPAPYQAALDNANASLLAARKSADRAKAAMEASIANVKRYEATLSLNQLNLKRYETLLKTKAASVMERDQYKTDVDVAVATLRNAEAQVESDRQSLASAQASIAQAEAAVKTNQINLDYCKIVAPISGRVGRSAVTEGAIVTAYQATALATIQQLDPIYVDVNQSTVEGHRLKRNLATGSLKDSGTKEVTILLEDGTEYPKKGSLQFRDVTVDQTTGSVILRIVVPNSDGTLLPNMFVQAIIQEGIREQAILVPQQGVTRDPKGNPLAMIVDSEGKIQMRGLETDRAIGDQWLISSGLAAGDRVIVEGTQRVRPGMSPNVIPFEAAKTAAKPEGAAQKTHQ